jgi:hypothetical protein
MNELRELNVAEMAQIEGGTALEDFVALLLEGLETLFGSIVLEPISEAIQGAVDAFLEWLGGLFGGEEST